MNGRVYDYNLGRFLSVDPLIHPEGGSQGINPYSYMMNNPLSGTDPTGYDPDEEVKTKTKFETQTGSRLKTKVTATSNGGSSYTVSFQGGNVSGVKSAYSNSLTGQGFEVSQIGGQAKQSSEISEGVKSAVYGQDEITSDYSDFVWKKDNPKETTFTEKFIEKVSSFTPQQWEAIGRESISLGLNILGGMAGGALLALPEPTTATKWLGVALYTKSATGVGLNISNLRDIWHGNNARAPNSLANWITQDMGDNAKLVGNLVDLSIDFASGRAAANAVMRYVPVSGQYGISRNLDRPYTVQHALGSGAENISTVLTTGQTGITLYDLNTKL